MLAASGWCCGRSEPVAIETGSLHSGRSSGTRAWWLAYPQSLDLLAPERGKPVLVSVLIDPDEREESRPCSVGKVGKDGSFKVENIPAGNYHAIVTSNSNSGAWRDYISKEVIASGKDVGDSGFSTAGGVTSIDIVVSPKGGTIAGTVLDDKDTPIADVQVVCMPDARRPKRRDVYQEAQTDQRGHFVIARIESRGIPSFRAG